MNQIKVSFYRGKTIESTHVAKILIKDLSGKTILSTGHDNNFIYPRSAIKVFQAIPFIKSNAVKHFKLNSKSIALASSSHRGETFHIKELNKWIDKIGLNKNKLQCGIHYPLNKIASDKLLKSNKEVNQLHNNCAGKHLAMITSCKMNKYKTSNYLNFNHPHQIKIREIFEKFSNEKIHLRSYGVDGCSAPQYSFKIKDIALMLANLIKSYNREFYYSDEIIKLVDSIMSNPKFIGGTDSLDSQIMFIAKNKIFCKGGAEGVFLFSHLKKRVVGIIKIVDGNERAIPSLVYTIFKKFKIFNKRELDHLKKIHNFKLINHSNINIGRIETKL